MKTYELQNGNMVETANGTYAQVTEGQMQRNDVLLHTVNSSPYLYRVVKTSKNKALVKGFNSKNHDLSWEVKYNRNELESVVGEHSTKVFRKIA